MKTLQEAQQEQGITLNGDTLNLHFSPLPNWYGCILGFDCPICGKPIDWKWEGDMPNFTNAETTKYLKPVVTSAKLLAFGHRWISLECDNCHTKLTAENFG